MDSFEYFHHFLHDLAKEMGTASVMHPWSPLEGGQTMFIIKYHTETMEKVYEDPGFEILSFGVIYLKELSRVESTCTILNPTRSHLVIYRFLSL